MYYLDESYDGPPGNYGLDAGSNDAAGGRGQTAPHNASHHHAPMYIPPHMMTMPNHAYMPSVPNTHQLHMNPLNVHSHLTAPSGPSLRTSAEIPPMQYSTNQASSMQHRPNPTYHPTQSQSSQVSMASSSGVSGGVSSGQPRVHVPMSAANMSSQWPWPPPVSSKVTGMAPQQAMGVQPTNQSGSAPMSHPQHMATVPTKSSMPTASTSAWSGAPPRSLLATTGASGTEPRFRPQPGAMPSSPTKYMYPNTTVPVPSTSMTSTGARTGPPKSVANFLTTHMTSNGKTPFYNYTPSSALGGSGTLTASGNSMTPMDGTGAQGHTANSVNFADASVYVPSSHSGSLHAPSQHLTSSQHHHRTDPMEEYIANSIKRRNALKQKEAAAALSNAAQNASGGNANASSIVSGRSATPGVGNSKDKSGSGSPSKSGPQSLGSSTNLSIASSASMNNMSTTDTTNWQILDMSGMQLNVVSPHVALYSHISVLHLQHNRLVSLPVEICSLFQLRSLDLSHNMLAWLPAEIGQLLCLKELLLDHNQLRSLPMEIGKLFRLTELSVDANPITDVPIEVLSGGATAIVSHLRNMFAPTGPPPPRSWLLSATADRSLAMPGYFHGLDALGPKAVRTVEGGHKQVTIQSDDVAKFRIEGSLRTMCYNVLADIYATSLNYCPSWALNWNHRKMEVLREIDLYNPDLLCLQEVVWAQYLQFFLPELEQRGYKGAFHPKTRIKYSADMNRVDGCASFYRASMFEEVQTFNIEFQTIAQENPERYSTPGDEAGYLRLVSKDNIAVGLVLRRKDRAFLQQQQQHMQQQQRQQQQAAAAAAKGGSGGGGRRAPASPLNPPPPPPPAPEDDLLVFVNTHIHWDPDFSDVKLMQVQILMEQLEAWMEEFSSSPNQPLRIPLILGGDFNSMPDSGVYQFLVEGTLQGDHPDFLGYTYGDYTDSGLKHSFPLQSANSTLASEPPFTNYTGDFNGVLDYIWYTQNSLNVERVLNGVDESVVHAYNGALPNPHMPSDHIPLVTDFVQNMNRRG